MVSGNTGNNSHFFLGMAEHATIFDQIVGMLMMPVATNEHTNIMQHRCRPEQVTYLFRIIVQ